MAVVHADGHGVSFVFGRSLVKIRVHESARRVADRLDSTRNRRLLAVNVEDVHEDRDLERFFARHGVFGALDLADAPVDGTHHGALVERQFTNGIAEELEAEEEKKQEDVSEEVPVDHPVEKKGDDGEARQNGPAFAGDDGIRREFVHCGMLQ